MKVNAETEPELAAQVKRILLDGKPIPLSLCHAADEEEGWVESYVPSLASVKTETGPATELEDSYFSKVRRYGKVEIFTE